MSSSRADRRATSVGELARIDKRITAMMERRETTLRPTELTKQVSDPHAESG